MKKSKFFIKIIGFIGLLAALTNCQSGKKSLKMNDEVLKTISDEDVVQAIVNYITDDVIKDNWKNEHKIVKKQPVGFQYIYALFLLESEVNNGGFNQYFFNSSGQFVDEAYAACIAIGAERTADSHSVWQRC